jgi:methionyl-tRNA synthetase
MSQTPSFYITTAIDYSNDSPHLGTSYEKIGADVIARYKRLCGYTVFFQMGNDEHSQNVKKKAQSLALDPQIYCDEMAEKFKKTWAALNISYDNFIQTSHPEHRAMVQEIVVRIHRKGDIYKGKYTGFYCVSCEAFKLENELTPAGLCPNHLKAPDWIEEENYFFALSRYTSFLKDLIATQENFICPATRKNEILQVIESGLQDVSISRARTDWGVPFPFDSEAITYVWFDALINYISGIGLIESENFKRFWPCDLHVIGKDITRFHALIWPAMLQSAGLALPKRVWAHGFLSVDGQKLSKSLGNAIDPLALVERYGADAIRYFLMREINWAKDGDYSETRLQERYTADLVNDLGNLVNRTLAMAQKYLNSVLLAPENEALPQLAEARQKTFLVYQENMDSYSFHFALENILSLVSLANKQIADSAPWAVIKESDGTEKVSAILFGIVSTIHMCAICLYPFMPQKMELLLTQLGVSIAESSLQKKGWQMQKEYRLSPPQVLFPKLTAA